MPSDAAIILYEMESEILTNITRLLASGNYSSAEWQMWKLEQLGVLRAANIETVNNYLAEAQAAIKDQLAKASAGAISLSELGISGTLSAGASATLASVLSVWENKTMNQFRNLGMTLIDSAEKKYIEIVYKTTTEALTGVKTLREAIADTATTWLAGGLPGLIDKKGAEWSVEAYAQTVVRSNIRQVVTESQNTAFDDFDVDLVEVSSHLGARELCAPYQGRIFSRSGKSTQYPALSSTSMGQPAGLFGINCGHRMFAYQPGTPKTYQPYNKKENEQAYANSQKQRYLERQIRAGKRELQIAESLKDSGRIRTAKEKISARQQKMRDFIKESGRTRRNDREQIY